MLVKIEEGVCLSEINYDPYSVTNNRYSKILKKYGRYFDRLVLLHGNSYRAGSRQVQNSLCQSFIIQPLTRCVELKLLTIRNE